MKVRVFGFEWFMGDGITLDDFCSHLQSISGNEIEGNRVVALTRLENYWGGVLLTIKDMKAFCKIKKNGVRFTVTPEELQDNASMVDFNFFIIHPETGRGLYQHYHQSPASNTFCQVCQRQYNFYKTGLIEADLNEAGGDALTENQKVEIKKKYKGRLTYNTLVRPDSFEDCLDQINRALSFSFELDTITANERQFTAATEFADRLTHKVIFTKKTWTESVRESIAATIRNDPLKRATIKGIDNLGEEVVFKLTNDYAYFDEADYHELISSVEIDSENIVESIRRSHVTKFLVEVASDGSAREVLESRVR